MKLTFHFESIFVPILLVLMMWVIFILQYFGLITECYGIIPWNIDGLKGILFAPLLHGSWGHLINNTITFTVVTFLVFQFYNRIAYYVMILGWIFTGLFVWLIPSFASNIGFYDSCHIGASGLIYVFTFFLFFSGIFIREAKLIAISLIVVFLYGGMIWGVLPQELFGFSQTGNPISWQSHLGGAITGTFMAFIFRKYLKIDKNKPSWEQNNYNTEKDEELWATYKENFPEHFEEIDAKKPIKKDNWDELL